MIYVRRFVVFTLLVCACSLPAVAQDMPVVIEGGADFYSKYINRGYVLANKVVVQPTATLTFGETGLNFNLWGSVPVQQRGTLRATDQLNLSLNLDRAINEDQPFSVLLGYIQYTFPRVASGSKHSEEFYAGLRMDHAVAPKVVIYYDFGLADGAYVTAEINPSTVLNDGGSMFAGVNAVTAFSNVSNRSFGFHNFALSGWVNYTHSALSIGPVVEYVYSKDDVNLDNSEFRGGLKIRLSM